MSYGPRLIGTLKNGDQVMLFSDYVNFVTGQLVRSIFEMERKCGRKDYEALRHGLDTAMIGFADLTRFLNTKYMIKLSPDPVRNNQPMPCQLLGRDITLPPCDQLERLEG